MNAVVHVEIPVSDMERAVRFYEAVLGHALSREVVDGYEMAFFPDGEGEGASVALAQGDVYVPARTGPIIYFAVPSIDAVLARAAAEGAPLLYAKKAVAGAGLVAEFGDSEGNRIALMERPA